MDWRKQAYARHQQQRWLRPDAARWMRSDAAKFLKVGTRLEDVYPALAQQRDALRHAHDRAIADAIAQERAVLAALRAGLDEINAELAWHTAEQKYNENQPRVSAGNSDGGQWTSGSGGSSSGRPRVYISWTNPDSEEIGDGGVGSSLPMGSIDFGDIDFGDIASEIDKLDPFDIKPRKPRSGGVRLAGELPRGIGDNGGPPLDPPEIPKLIPESTEGRMGFVRGAARWIARIGRRAPAVDVFLGALDQANYLKRQTDMIKTANDPPRTLDELQSQIGKTGYQRHHIAEESAARVSKYPEILIQRLDNLAGVPILKRIEVSRYYSTKTKREDVTWRSPRDDLKDADFDTRRAFGLTILEKYGVLK